jgi:hypothetical protein
MAKVSKAKKPKATKITSVTIRENRNKDFSPSWDNCDEMDARQYLRHYHSSMQYYNLQFKGKDLKPAVIKWMNANDYDQTTIAEFKKVKDWRSSLTMGAIASCLLKGMPSKRDDFNDGRDCVEWLKSAITEVIRDGRNDTENDDESDDDAEKKPAAPAVSIQERVRDVALKMTDEIEDAIEVWMETPDKFDPKQFKILNLLKGKDVKAAHARIIREYYSRGLAELTELVSPTEDQDLKDGYKHRSKKQINNLLAFYKEIDAACGMLIEESKVSRKPKIKKPVPKDKLVEKLKYLKMHEPLKLVSINPTDIIGAKELWIFNVKTRKIGKYIADELTGPLTIKGSTILGFDDSKSIQKTVRKPEEKIKEFKSANKAMLKKFLDEINTTDTKLNGRISEDVVLLKTL